MHELLRTLIKQFMPYAKEKIGFKHHPRLFLRQDAKNAANPLGKTAYYDPEASSVTLYVTDRHPKDVMRSLSHELVHHTQHCNGEFENAGEMGEGYAQNNPHMRKMEREAYTKGNLIFRDFEDLIKTGKVTIDIDFKKSGEPKMSLKEWKDNELNTLLMKKWGLLKEDKGWGKDPQADTPGGPEKEAAAKKFLKKEAEETEELEEECPFADAEEGGEEIDISEPGMEVHVDDVSQLSPEDAFGAGIAAAKQAIDDLVGPGAEEEGPDPLIALKQQEIDIKGQKTQSDIAIDQGKLNLEGQKMAQRGQQFDDRIDSQEKQTTERIEASDRRENMRLREKIGETP